MNFKRFSEIVPRLVFEKPFITAREIAETALARGLFESSSRDPIGSLATTVSQRVRNGRMPGVERATGKGRAGDPYSYIPTEVDVQVRITLELESRSRVTGQTLKREFKGSGDSIHGALLAPLKGLEDLAIERPETLDVVLAADDFKRFLETVNREETHA